MKKSVNNPDFRNDPEMDNSPLTTQELMGHIEKESPYVQGKFRRQGYITRKDFDFVNMANFDLEKNSIVDEKLYPQVAKNENEKILAEANTLAIEEYLRKHIKNKNIHIKFFHGKTNIYQCALVNIDKKFSVEEEKELYEYLYGEI